MTTPSQRSDPVREDLVEAGIRLLAHQGPGALVMRRVAAAAGVSTMCVYSRFGDKAGLIDAVYRKGFERLDEVLTAANTGPGPLQRVISLALAYRSFAVANPALYSLMFERMVGFDPPTDVETPGLGATLMVEAVIEAMERGELVSGSPAGAIYLIWTAVHGAVGLELAQVAHHPMRTWLVDTPATGEAMVRQVVDTTLRGMAPTAIPTPEG